MIVGFCGFQRSGKTSLAVGIARTFSRKYLMPVYTNLDAPGMNQITAISQIPVDYKSKILLWDEINWSLDSRKFKDNTDFTLFLNTCGKQRIMLLWTCVHHGDVDIRVRKYTNFLVFARDVGEASDYMLIDVQRARTGRMTIKRTPEWYRFLDYNSDLVIPNIIQADIDKFISNARGIGRG